MQQFPSLHSLHVPQDAFSTSVTSGLPGNPLSATAAKKVIVPLSANHSNA